MSVRYKDKDGNIHLLAGSKDDIQVAPNNVINEMQYVQGAITVPADTTYEVYKCPDDIYMARVYVTGYGIVNGVAQKGFYYIINGKTLFRSGSNAGYSSTCGHTYFFDLMPGDVLSVNTQGIVAQYLYYSVEEFNHVD